MYLSMHIGMKVIGINKNDNRNKFANKNEQRHQELGVQENSEHDKLIIEFEI